MDYEKAYKEAVKMLRYKISDNNGNIDYKAIITAEELQDIFSELKESEDEKIRRELITHCRNTRCVTEEGAERIAKWIAWLEKQKAITFNKDIEKMRNAAIYACKYMVDNFENSTKQYEDAIAWLEKQVPVDEDEIINGIRRGVAISLINHIDANSKGMCLSNIECKDIENAIVNEDWDKVYRYMNKKLEKQGENKPTLRERYENIAKSEWFKKTHDGMSCGMITPEESLGISSDEYNDIVDECIFEDDKESKTTHHEGWVNIFKCGLCYSVWGNIYPTKEDALNEIEGDEGDVYIATVKIEWEE